MWAAIQQMHMGSSDLKEDHQMNARREFFNFRMESGEPISTYQFRFEALCTKLSGLGITKEEITDKMKVHQLINSLAGDWFHERTTFRENPENRNLLLYEIFGKLLSYEKRKQEDKEQDKANKGIALKLEKMLKSVQEQYEDSEEDEDEELVLVTKALRSFYKKGKFKRNNGGEYRNNNKTGEKDLREVTCYKCYKKGHFAKHCPQGTEERKPNKKAYIVAWIDSDDRDPEAWVTPNLCTMAIGKSTREQPSEVTTETILDSLSNYDKPELIKLMSRLVKDNIK